ncbi:WAT1-related protein At5g07050-like [Nymphaea colorata]|nr:WAT1-related protein At5g07050-like [Nymphaea colorata]
MKGCMPYVAMVLVELAYVFSNFLCKAALENGMSFFVFIVYRHIMALLLLGPFAYVLERKIRPKLTVATAMKISFLAFCGTTIHQTLYYAGLSYTSPTVASALTNIIPALTFLVAVFLRMEAISFRSLSGRAKIFGTIISIAGALMFTLWKGIPLNRPSTPLINIYGKTSGHIGNGDWIRGSMLMSASFIAFTLYLIMQVFAIIHLVSLAMTSTSNNVFWFSALVAKIVSTPVQAVVFSTMLHHCQ